MPENLIANTDVFTGILLVIFLISFLIQLYYYLLIYLKAGFRAKNLQKDEPANLPVSLIICARNEADNLRQNLPAFLDQDYPDFEVVVVNDCSDDETAGLLEQFADKYQHLKVSTIKKDPKFSHGKKLALTIGIKASKNDYLLLSDADCIPAGKDWMRLMVRNFNDQKEIVLGVGLYKKKKGLLNLLIRFETAFTFMQYFGFAAYGKPYMGVGRNLAYTRELFFRNKGFASHANLKSGDDDLFINETAIKKNTALEKHPESFTYSEPETSFKNYLRQKKRHLTTGKFYQQSVKRMLVTEYSARILLNVSFIILLTRFQHFEIILLIYILQLFVKILCFNKVFRSLDEKFLLLPSLIVEPIIPFFYGFLHLINHLDRENNRWN